MKRPSASFTFVIRCKIKNEVGTLGRLFPTIGDAGGDVGAVDIVEVVKGIVIRDVSVRAIDDDHGKEIVGKLRGIDGVEVVHVSNRAFLMHLGGKIEIKNKAALKTRDDLSMAYTPGVARVAWPYMKTRIRPIT